MMLGGTLRLSECSAELWDRLNFFKPSSFKMGERKLTAVLKLMGKGDRKRDLQTTKQL